MTTTSCFPTSQSFLPDTSGCCPFTQTPGPEWAEKWGTTNHKWTFTITHTNQSNTKQTKCALMITKTHNIHCGGPRIATTSLMHKRFTIHLRPRHSHGIRTYNTRAHNPGWTCQTTHKADMQRSHEGGNAVSRRARRTHLHSSIGLTTPRTPHFDHSIQRSLSIVAWYLLTYQHS